MKKLKKRLSWIVATISVCLISCFTATVFATPSIGDLHESEAPIVSQETPAENSVTQDLSSINDLRASSQETSSSSNTGTKIRTVSADGTNTAEILSGYDIYMNKSVSTQYMRTDENGNLVATPLSNLIELSTSEATRTGENGNTIPNKIPTVKEIIESYCKEANIDIPGDTGVKLEQLDQLTYWQDFKYMDTDNKITAGESLEKDNQTVELDDGMIEAEIKGGEAFRSCNMDDYIFIQVDAKTGEIYFLKMKEYDADTGTYVVDFPSIGPYLITQIM